MYHSLAMAQHTGEEVVCMAGIRGKPLSTDHVITDSEELDLKESRWPGHDPSAVASAIGVEREVLNAQPTVSIYNGLQFEMVVG